MFTSRTSGIKNPNNVMRKFFFTYFLIFLFPYFLSAQEEKSQYIRKGLIRSQGTIAPGILLKGNVSTISIYGTFEGYISDNISLRGDSYYSIKSPFEFNHSIFSGASYHFKTKSHFDPYFAIEPGLSITKRPSFPVGETFAIVDPTLYDEKAFVNPLISSAFGFNFYFQKFFHLFVEGRYINGEHLSDTSIPISLNELRFSFGLGININVLKKK